MTIEHLRDLAIIVLAFVWSGVLIVGTIVTVSWYRKANSMLGHLDETSRNLKDVSLLIKDEVAKPLIQVATVVQGVRQGMDLVSQFMQSQEEGTKK